jgi:hypothetical protein
LYDNNCVEAGTHYFAAGVPTWEANDGSLVSGAAAGTPTSGITVDPSAIKWRLLTGTGSGSGIFQDITYVQRLFTTNGLAPSAGSCNAGTVTDEVASEYTAVYYFYTGP